MANKESNDGLWLGAALIIIAFAGDPNLIDALIYFLMNYK